MAALTVCIAHASISLARRGAILSFGEKRDEFTYEVVHTYYKVHPRNSKFPGPRYADWMAGGEQSIGMHESQMLQTFFLQNIHSPVCYHKLTTRRKAGSRLEIRKDVSVLFSRASFWGRTGTKRESYLPRAPSLPLLSHAGATNEL